MSALAADYTMQTVLIYDTDGKHLITTYVLMHEKDTKQIIVETLPDCLKLNNNCKVMILSAPVPVEFDGKIKRLGNGLCIAMFQGQERDGRSSERYSINTPAQISTLVVDGQQHQIQTPIKVMLMNISTTGLRFRAPFYSFEVGDQFQMDFSVGTNQKKAVVKVMNAVDNGSESSDYGCRFIAVQ
ncbi:MAG: PilZ domain-containing protein [Oscillospiraceae bacterium]|nr:PilZ domain-containing protein [Oscillospiraceae bacterium]